MRGLLVGLLFLSPSLAGAQIVSEMTPGLIEQAIKEGQRKPKKDLLGFPSGPLGFYQLKGPCFLTTPYSRVVRASHRAFTEYKSFTADQVTPEMVAPEAWVLCHALTFQRPPISVRAVVLTEKGSREPIPELRSDVSQDTYQNAYGAEYAAGSITAVYPLSALTPSREIHVVYVGHDEYRIKLDLDKVR